MARSFVPLLPNDCLSIVTRKIGCVLLFWLGLGPICDRTLIDMTSNRPQDEYHEHKK